MLRYAHLAVEGRAIHYATEGGGPPLLLLPTPPFDHRLWAPAIPYLSGRFRVVAPDLPGFGGSEAAEQDGAPDQLVRTVAGFVTAARMVPCAVAGAGLGGGAALWLAARYPERVSALVAVGALGLEVWPATAQARLARALRGVPGLLSFGVRLAPRAHARWYLRAAFADEGLIDEALVGQLAGTLRTKAARRALARTLVRLDDWRKLGRLLGAVRAPALLVWGERDALYGLPAAERLRHAIPGARLTTLPGAGHLLPLERPVELAEVMRRFLLGQ
ncbi:MAG TPA: alpha/beta fold hydrolase [Roseiflexaceae bacterium]|nr:alpha/beta fold hydrolase [Roseiflexaceae bacterium]